MSHRSRLSRAVAFDALDINPAELSEDQIVTIGALAHKLDSFFGDGEEDRLPVLHLTPTWSELVMVDSTDDDICFVWLHESGQLVCTIRTFIDKKLVPFTIPISHRATYETKADGSMKCYGMRQIGPHTWKIEPSVNIPGVIHAFVVLCNVPEPAPWGKV